MSDITKSFPIKNQEYAELNKEFGKLCYYIAHQLKKQNARNNFTEDIDDLSQELQIAAIHAGSYYKRQVYIEQCFEMAKKYAVDKFMKKIIEELENLWYNRTRHGAGRQKFGDWQEALLEKIIKKLPKKVRPNKDLPLVIDGKFARYCKAIIWNKSHNLGKKITRDKSIRTGLTSLSEYSYLASN